MQSSDIWLGQKRYLAKPMTKSKTSGNKSETNKSETSSSGNTSEKIQVAVNQRQVQVQVIVNQKGYNWSFKLKEAAITDPQKN